MIVKRVFRLAGMGAALSGLIVGGAVVAAAPAFAGTTSATTSTVTASKATMTSGQPVAFKVVVVPAKVGTTKITGTVAWTVTGHDGTVVPCTTEVLLSSGGVAKCSIDKGILLAGNSPYVASAVYSGDATFDSSTGSFSEPVTPTTTRVKIALSATPTSGAATVVTVTVVDGPATDLISGNVVFTIGSQYHQSGVAARCTGTLTPVANNNVKVVSAQTAVCTLPAGWMIVPRATTSNPKPANGWSISAVYTGNASFVTSYATKLGTAKF